MATPVDSVPLIMGCKWACDWEATWFSSCGQAHTFITGGPAENRHKFCPYCGNPIEQVNELYQGEAPNTNMRLEERSAAE